jgi:hypothetical protein
MIKFQDFEDIMKIINRDFNVKYQLISSDDGHAVNICLSKNDKIFIIRVKTEYLNLGHLFEMVNDYTDIFHKMFYDDTYSDLPKRKYVHFDFIK